MKIKINDHQSTQKRNTHKYISRGESRYTKGWLFRFPINGNWKHCESKYFSDEKYGTKTQALNAAKKYKESYLEQRNLQHLAKRRKPKVQHANSRNSSGIVGVGRTTSFKAGKAHDFWESGGKVDNKRWKRAFSCARYGEKAAFLQACRERYQRHGPLDVMGQEKDLPYTPDVPYTRAQKQTDQ